MTVPDRRYHLTPFTENHAMTRWKTLPDPNGPALVAPGWASAETKRLADDAAKMFDATKAARAEAERLRAATGTVDLMTTDPADLVDAGSTARQAMIEALRDELVARAKFGEYLAALESDRRRAQTESAAMVDQARSDAKQRLLDAGFPDLSEAVTARGGGTVPDHEARAAFDRVLNSFPGVLEAGDVYQEARTMTGAILERAGYNRRHREEAESSLRKMLESLASLAVA